MTRGPGPACRMPPPDLLRWGQGAAVWEGGSAARIVNAVSQIEAGSCSSSHRRGGGEGQGKAPWLLGPGPKHRLSSSFSQEWATLSGCTLDRTPALWWTVQKYLKTTPRSQKVCFDDPFSPFQKFKLRVAHRQTQHLPLPWLLCSKVAVCGPLTLDFPLKKKHPEWGIFFHNLVPHKHMYVISNLNLFGFNFQSRGMTILSLINC